MRALFQFGKLGRLRYISHLDLQRFMQRALRRTDLPVAYSQGFNPHAQMAFASALAMGWSSEYELLDVKLAEEVEAQHALEQLRAALPPEMPVYAVRLVDDRHPALMAQLAYADYRIEFQAGEGEKLFAAIPGYLAEESVMALRKTKSGEKPADVRKMTERLSIVEPDCLLARLELKETATLKPDLLIHVLAERAGIEAPAARIHRIGLLGWRENELVSLLDL